MAIASSSAPLDLASLFCSNHKPSRVSILEPKEAFTWNDTSKALDEPVYHHEDEHDEQADLIRKLVSKTPTYIKHVEEGLPPNNHDDIMEMVKRMPSEPQQEWKTLAPALHQVQLANWELMIDWEGKKEDTEERIDYSCSASKQLLAKRRNPYLDALVFDNSNVNWEGDVELGAKMSQRIQIILELGIAGQSIARHVLPVSRPTSFGQSEAYHSRYEREWSTPITSTAEVSKGSLHADKDKMEAFIEARQRKRAQMAKDKTNRVTQAMGTLQLGGGKGRTITSSLMGPGGTERTGRPNRHVGSGSLSYDAEYIEQLDLVYNHTLVKTELNRVELRQYHRPKLPLNFVRRERPWQLQIRFVPSTKKVDSSSNATSYQSMMGSHAGALSQTKIRTEADLNPTEGMLVMFEYSEERPCIQLTKGMSSKIVNYYRGDKVRCPVSAGGGDRPSRRKRADHGSTKDITEKSERPPRLIGPSVKTTLEDWIGKPPKKKRDEQADKLSIDILPEGVTEILHPKIHGPFIGEVEEGVTQSGLITNMFAAPIFRHEPESSDFLMILGRKPITASRSTGLLQQMSVVLRPMPASVFCVGQVEPRERGMVHAPQTSGERTFTAIFLSYLIAKTITWYERNENRGLRFDEISDLFHHTGIQANALRQRIKSVAHYDKNSQIWDSKPITDYDDYPGVEALGRKVAPEGVACYEMACATARRLCDIGLTILYSGSNNVTTVGAAIAYLTGDLNSSRDISRKLKKMLEFARSSKTSTQAQIAFYEKAAEKLDEHWKDIRRKHEVARFIYEELQLASWNLTFEFIDVHKLGHGTGMMKLTGIGDPSGLGEAYNYIREVDTKPHKVSAVANDGALNAQIKKITGTDNDLRKLTMKQMASLLRSYGMAQKDIDRLKRWDRVHVIRDLSTKAASDGMGDGLERFARGEKLKLSEQKQMYRDRIQEIWRRQRSALSTDVGDLRTVGQEGSIVTGDVESKVGDPAENVSPQKKSKVPKDDDSDSDESDDEDLVAMLEEDMMDVRQTNQLVAAHQKADGSTNSQDLTKDAREFAALKRQREEERAAKEGFDKNSASESAPVKKLSMIGQKVIRRTIIKRFPDGRQTTSFKFIIAPDEVEGIIAQKKETEEEDWEDERLRRQGSKHVQDYRAVGHTMFEDDDDYDHARMQSGGRGSRSRGIKKKGTKTGPKMKPPKMTLGKLKDRVSAEKRLKKRKREAEEADLYVAHAKRKGTSNRRERGSIRERAPHVLLSEKLESLRSEVEKRPDSGPFHRPVNRRSLPRYYEVISNPMDLQTIRDKNARYEYKTPDAMLKDFDLMRANAIKFNGKGSALGNEACAIYEFFKVRVDENRVELDSLTMAVEDHLNGKKKKRHKKALSPASAFTSGTNVVVDGVAVHLGDLDKEFEEMEGGDSDSDDSFTGMIGLG